jgi:head-tail adaptor
MTTNIGTYRDVIHFGRIVKVSDGMGGYSEAFSEFASVRGRAITSASEISLDGDTRNVYNYTFECRYIDGIYPDMVIKLNDDTHIWQIKDVIDPSGKRERLRFSATRDVENSPVPVIEEEESDD